MVSFPDCLASAVHAAYRALPARGKPQGTREFTVVSGIGMTMGDRVTVGDGHGQVVAIDVPTSECDRCRGRTLPPASAGSEAPGDGDSVGDSASSVGVDEPERKRQRTALPRASEPAQRIDSPERLRLVALASGTRCCPGRCNYTHHKDCVVDSHAEVLAKRALHQFLLEHVKRAVCSDDGTDVLEWRTTEGAPGLVLRAGLRFHLYVSVSPCGDASIFEIDDGQDVNRTGAPCAPGEPPDPHNPGTGWHLTGTLRTKPGRGDPSDSHSCSDKIAKWSLVGVQGTLLRHWLARPIYLSTITVGEQFNYNALERALHQRLAQTKTAELGRYVLSEHLASEMYWRGRTEAVGYHMHKIGIMQTAERFEHGRAIVEQRLSGEAGIKLAAGVPSGYALWTIEATLGASGQPYKMQPAEVTVATTGKKMGYLKKNLCNPKARSALCEELVTEQHQSIANSATSDTINLGAMGHRAVGRVYEGVFAKLVAPDDALQQSRQLPIFLRVLAPIEHLRAKVLFRSLDAFRRWIGREEMELVAPIIHQYLVRRHSGTNAAIDLVVIAQLLQKTQALVH